MRLVMPVIFLKETWVQEMASIDVALLFATDACIRLLCEFIRKKKKMQFIDFYSQR